MCVYIYINLSISQPRGVRTHLWARPGTCPFPQNSLFSHTKTTHFSFRREAQAVWHTPLGRPWGRIGLPELSKGVFGMPKECLRDLNLIHAMSSRQDFKGRLARNGTGKPRTMERERQLLRAPFRIGCFLVRDDHIWCSLSSHMLGSRWSL